MKNMIDHLFSRIEDYRSLTAVELGGLDWTYRQFGEMILQAGSWLGPLVNQRGCLVVPANTIHSIACFYGLVLAEKLPMLSDPTWGISEILDIASRLQTEIVVLDKRSSLASAEYTFKVISESPEMLVVRLPILPKREISVHKDAAFVRFTSGSSGRPKALQFDSRAAINAADNWLSGAKLSSKSRVLCLAGISNGLAFNTSLLPVFLSGAALILHDGPLLASPILNSAINSKATALVGFPFIYQLLLQSRKISTEHLANIKQFISSAAPLSNDIEVKWRDKFCIGIGSYYGLAEVGPVTFNPGEDIGGLGYPLKACSIKIVPDLKNERPIHDHGLVAVKTNSMALEYLSEDNHSINKNIDADGYFVTKDIGYLDHRAQLKISARVDRVLNIAGKKFSAEEIERVIKMAPGVSNVWVGLEQGKIDSFLVAYVETENSTDDEIKQFCLKTLKPAHVPDKIVAVRSLPKSVSGKTRSPFFK